MYNIASIRTSILLYQRQGSWFAHTYTLKETEYLPRSFFLTHTYNGFFAISFMLLYFLRGFTAMGSALRILLNHINFVTAYDDTNDEFIDNKLYSVQFPFTVPLVNKKYFFKLGFYLVMLISIATKFCASSENCVHRKEININYCNSYNYI